MNFIKFFTGTTFDNEGFVKMLKEQMNVRACVTKDGVILDRDAFLSVPARLMPHWAFINREHIKSSLHTRPAAPAEWPELNPKYRYMLVVLMDDNVATETAHSDSLNILRESCDDLADSMIADSVPGFLSANIIDTQSKEILYTAN